MDPQLHGKTALVTGGSEGIGKGIALALAKEGVDVAICARRKEPLEKAAGEIAKATNRKIVAIPADLRKDADAKNFIEQAHAALGRIDIMINNIGGRRINVPIEDQSLADWQAMIALNLTSTFLLARAAETMLRAASGAIVTIASTRAHQSEPHGEAYAASKGGLVALTHALAASFAGDVRVNCISPGWILTKGPAPSPEDDAQHWAGRVGQAEDIAAAVAFLLGAEAGFITGAELVIDGGMTRKMIYA